jgi:hypothetical protein
MRLANATEEEPEANRISSARHGADRMEPQLFLAHVLTQLVNIALDGQRVFQGHILRSLLWPQV